MIKIPYKDVSDFNFQTALQKLANTAMDSQSAYRVKKIFDGVRKLRNQVADEYKKDVMPKFAKRDEKGEFSTETFQVDPEKEKEFIAAQEEFGMREGKIERFKLVLNDIRSAQLSPLEQLALEPVLDDSQGEVDPTKLAVPQMTRVK